MGWLNIVVQKIVFSSINPCKMFPILIARFNTNARSDVWARKNSKLFVKKKTSLGPITLTTTLDLVAAKIFQTMSVEL